jgi:hypothetical protein
MKLPGCLLCVFLLTVSEFVFSQTPGLRDSSFSLFFNSGLSFTHANDPHINRWLEKYGYPAEPHVPSSLNFEVAAIPASSNYLYSVKLSTINSGKNLTSFNILGGLYKALVNKRNFLLFAGTGAGYHDDIITLTGDMPADYKQLAAQVHSTLALRRTGLFIEPALRAFWFPVSFHNVQLGLVAGLGYDLDFNSRWRLGYYDNNHGKYNHFRKLKKPDDQLKVSEYGFSYNAGITLRVNLH